MESAEMNALRDACAACVRCPLGQTRTNLVFGVGNPQAEILFVGSATDGMREMSAIHRHGFDRG